MVANYKEIDVTRSMRADQLFPCDHHPVLGQLHAKYFGSSCLTRAAWLIELDHLGHRSLQTVVIRPGPLLHRVRCSKLLEHPIRPRVGDGQEILRPSHTHIRNSVETGGSWS